MRFAALITIAILIGSCASTRTGGDNDFKYHLEIQNGTYQTVTVYLLNGGARSRLRDCEPIIPCGYYINPVRSADLLRDGVIILGWRWANMPPRLLAGQLVLDVPKSRSLILYFDQHRAWLHPGYGPGYSGQFRKTT